MHVRGSPLCVTTVFQDNEAVATLMNDIGVMHFHQHRPQEALESIRGGVAMFRRLHGKKSPMPPAVIRGTYNLANVYHQLGDEVQAQAMLVLSKAMAFEADVRSGNTVTSTPLALRSNLAQTVALQPTTV